jgi:hypothetical protein
MPNLMLSCLVTKNTFVVDVQKTASTSNICTVLSTYTQCYNESLPEKRSRYMNTLQSGSNAGGVDIFCPRVERQWSPLVLLCNVYRVSFPGLKRPGNDVERPSHGQAWVELYLHYYLFSGSGKYGVTFTFNFIKIVNSIRILSSNMFAVQKPLL